MGLIPCTDNCIYQQEGCCTLTRAGSGGVPMEGKGCVHFLPRQPGQGGAAALRPQEGREQSRS